MQACSAFYGEVFTASRLLYYESTMPTTVNPESALANARAQDQALAAHDRERRAERERILAKRRHFWMLANRAGMTYEEIREATGYSSGLICREIARAAREAGVPRVPRGRRTVKAPA